MRVRRPLAVLVGAVLALAALSAVGPSASAAGGPTGTLVHSGLDAQLRSVLLSLDLQTQAGTQLEGSEYGDWERSIRGTLGSPDGTQVLVHGYYGGIFANTVAVFDIGAKTWTDLYMGTDGDVVAMDWLPDGSGAVAVVSVPPTDMNIHGIVLLRPGQPMQEIPGTRAIAQTVDGIAISPSGDQLAISRKVGGLSTVSIMNLDGTGLTPLGAKGVVNAWTHDGSRIVLSVPLYDGSGAAAGAMAQTVTPRGGSATFLPQTYMPHGGRVTLSPDDAWLTVEAVRTASRPETDVSVVPFDGSAVATPEITGPDDVPAGASYVGAWTSSDATAPTMTAVTGVLGATGATLSWPSIVAADTAGVRVAVSPGATPPASYAAGARRATVLGSARSAGFTGLVAGATYSYSAWAFDGAGNESAPVTGHFRLIPAATAVAPAIASSASAAAVTVAYRSGGTGTAAIKIAAFAYAPGITTSQVVDVAGLSGVLAWRTATQFSGWNVRFRAGAVDAWGNVRWASTYAYTQVPYDDRVNKLVYAGAWSSQSVASAWAGTTRTTTAGGSVTVGFSKVIPSDYGARRISVVATTSTTGGRVKVYIDGRYVTTVSTRATSTRYRQVVFTSALLARTRHTIKLVHVSGSGAFRLDGISALYTT